MYLNHWKLVRPPFEAQPDSRFLFATEQHERALAASSYAACEGGEPVLIAGPAGCGKTLLLRALRRKLPRERFHVAFVPEASCAPTGLLRRVAYHLAHTVVPDAGAAMEVITAQAEQARANEGTLVIMLDGWPVQASEEHLAELRWLLDLDLENGRSCVLLTSEDAWTPRRWPTWLLQRLFTTAELKPLTADDVAPYLAHRLAAAADECGGAESGKTPSPFTSEAAARIAEWSWGVPRLINRAAHLALHVAWLNLALQVTPEHVEQALARLLPCASLRTDVSAGVSPSSAPTTVEQPAPAAALAGAGPNSGRDDRTCRRTE